MARSMSPKDMKEFAKLSPQWKHDMKVKARMELKEAGWRGWLKELGIAATMVVAILAIGAVCVALS